MQRKFALTLSGIKIYSKMWELCMRSFYSINFQIRQIPATDQNFPGKNNPFLLSLTVAWVEISEKKKTSIFLV